MAHYRAHTINHFLKHYLDPCVDEQTNLTRGPEECKSFLAYVGTKSTTITGKTCQKWNINVPHFNDYNDPSLFPGQNMDHNYCRNPSQESIGPWCYTTEEGLIKERCFFSIGMLFFTSGSKLHSLRLIQ